MNDGTVNLGVASQSPPKNLREASPIHYAISRNNLERDRIEHERLVTRRDSIRDKLRSGLTVLNGGSLVALLAALNGDGTAAAWVGITAENAKWVAGGFVLGLITAGIAYRADEFAVNSEVGDSIVRVQAAEQFVAMYEANPTAAQYEELQSQIANYYELPLVGHRYSVLNILPLALSQGLWLTGILTPILTTFFE